MFVVARIENDVVFSSGFTGILQIGHHVCDRYQIKETEVSCPEWQEATAPTPISPGRP